MVPEPETFVAAVPFRKMSSGATPVTAPENVTVTEVKLLNTLLGDGLTEEMEDGRANVLKANARKKNAKAQAVSLCLATLRFIRLVEQFMSSSLDRRAVVVGWSMEMPTAGRATRP